MTCGVKAADEAARHCNRSRQIVRSRASPRARNSRRGGSPGLARREGKRREKKEGRFGAPHRVASARAILFRCRHHHRYAARAGRSFGGNSLTRSGRGPMGKRERERSLRAGSRAAARRIASQCIVVGQLQLGILP